MSTPEGREVYKKYCLVCVSRGPEYFETENYSIETNNTALDSYEIIDKVGKGKYGDVYKAIRVGTVIQGSLQPHNMAALKILKPVRVGKIKREIKVLRILNHPNIIHLQNVMQDQCSLSYVLAFPYFEEILNKQDYSAGQIRGYLRQLLEVLSYSHSMGIMHRDIKPQNILIDRQNESIRVIDWGLAEFYLPNMEYNIRVGSRYFKSPQLLLMHNYYDYAVDMWSAGCIFAALLFRVRVFFQGSDNIDQMKQIIQVVGSEEVDVYIRKFKMQPNPAILKWVAEGRKKVPLQKFREKSKESISPQALDLLKKMLIVDHTERINAYDALKHPYFAQEL